ncbi:HlyD family type I secretion periplasmic adaptor subunit [Sphingomonas sp. 2R-10]|uniref:HlyD family type I secretion periplasmic adaptor subunit n=1 Tax=Sphingomonas sp. 2R-10 TaxID=3045148 RepID=UPI000F78CD0A|nr:HlyD family type I secretion periplasmic adaptor subunit [Sphingomonas sp. 2R-10]MDJ0275584.1 HlyD family type I secretion periplasmic adaptor subunit [Sphingomonas sp. 2R-10]
MTTNVVLPPRGIVPNAVAAHALLDDSPRRPAMVGVAVGLVFFVGFLGWAGFARLDAAAVGTGQVAVMGNRQTVQHRDGGTVGQVLVREGQHVAAGQLLVSLAAPEVDAQERALAESVIGLEAQQARLEAEVTGGPIRWPEAFAGYAGRDARIAERARAVQSGQSSARGGMLAASGNVNVQRRRETEEQIRGYVAQARSTREQRESLQAQLASARTLQDKGFVSLNAIRQLERSVSQMDAAIADLNARVAASRASNSGVASEDVQNRRRMQTESSAALRDTLFQLNEMRPKWLAARDQLRRTAVRAPVAGRIVGLSVFSQGAVLAPGQRVLDIVPDAAPLIVRTQFAPGDIDGVEEGREAEVRFLSLHQRDLPIILGSVRSVSADALTDERTGASHYEVDVAVPPSQYAALQQSRGGKSAGIRPGIPVQVFIRLRKRTALQYMFDPLVEAFSRSFRER